MSPPSNVAPDPSTERSSDIPDASASSLDDRPSTLEKALRKQYAAYFDAIADRLGSLQSELQQICERHDALRDDVSLDTFLSQTSPAAWNDLWSQICTYRQRLRKEILRPLHDHLDDEPLGSVLVGRRAKLIESLQSILGEQPDTVSRAEPDALYTPDPDDRWARRLQKAWVRSRRHAQSVLGIEDANNPTQTIPFHALAHHHTDQLVNRHQPVIDELEDRLMGWVADLERVLTSATHTLLEFEQRIDHLDFHHTQPKRGALSPPAASPPDLAASLDVPQAPPSPDLLASVQDEIEALDAVLRDAATLSIEDLRSELCQHIDDQVEALYAAVDRPWPTVASSDAALSSQSRSWTEWDNQARARLRLCETMIAFYADTEKIRDAMIHELMAEGPSPVQEQFEAITNQLADSDADLKNLLNTDTDLDTTSSTLEAPLEDALTIVDEKLGALRDTPFAERLQRVVQTHLDSLDVRVNDLPGTVSVHSLSPPDAPPNPSATEHEVPVQAGAEVTFDVLFFDQLRSAAQHLVDVLTDEIDQAGQVREVLHFGLDAAKNDKLGSDVDGSGTLPQDLPDPATPDPSLDETDTLVRGSLHRSRRLLKTRQERIDAAAYQWADTVWHAFRHSMTRLHEQWTTESRFQSRIARLTRKMAREAREAAAEAQEQVQKGQLRLQNWREQSRRWLTASWHAVRSALGLTDAGTEEIRESVETIASLGSSLERLPIVYRRLFSFEPVENPDLFKGRDEERVFVDRYVERWRRGLPASLLLVGDRGSGLTSLLKVIRATTLNEATLHHLRLDARPGSEAQLAAQVARTLGLDLPSRSTLSLEDVGQALREDPMPDSSDESSPHSFSAPDGEFKPVRACFVEHLEQLLLQTVGGLDLLDRMLTLISRTDAHVLWIGTMSTAAWQLVEKRLPSASELITHEHVDPLSRDAIEEAIMSRHRRSGLVLHFDAPNDGGPLSSQSRQEKRREAFFDRLHEVSHQNVALALLYWFRSVEPQEDGQGLRVKSLQPISFRVLDELTLEQSFALKAFLVHSSLTVEEYSVIAQIPTADSIDLMESLGNASLIEPVDGPAGRAFDVYFEAVASNVRYRIRPLLVAPIVQHLKAHNIVH